MKYNINVIKSVWRQWRKPSRATLDSICSQNPRNTMLEAVIAHPRRNGSDASDAMYEANREVQRKAQTLDSGEWKRVTQTLHSAVWQLVARLEADRRDVLTMAKAVLHSRDVSVDRRPSSVSINILRDTVARMERRNA
jgi:hypothetical protein